MIAWSTDIFQNEEALDWLSDLLDERDVYFVHNTLEIIADWPEGERPEAWDWLCALAAAEVLAAAQGNPPTKFPLEASEWIDAYGFQPDEEALDLAKKALTRIGQQNEWISDDQQQCKQWMQVLGDLRRRLGV